MANTKNTFHPVTRPENFSDEQLAHTMRRRSDEWIDELIAQAEQDIVSIDRELVISTQDLMHRRRQCTRTIDAAKSELFQRGEL